MKEAIVDRRTRSIIVGIRLMAIAAVLIGVPLLWKAMLWLPWQIDCLLAVGASFAFAYHFEREEAR